MAGSELWMALALATYPLLVSFKKVSLVVPPCFVLVNFVFSATVKSFHANNILAYVCKCVSTTICLHHYLCILHA